MITKICSKCSIPKPKDQFHKGSKYKDGLQYWCKLCMHEKDVNRHLNNPTSTREKRWKYSSIKNPDGSWFKLSDFNKFLDLQQNRCAICNGQTPYGRGTWHVDHSHIMGLVRGLLCMKCNQILSHAQDNIERLYNAIGYLLNSNPN